MTKIHEKLAEEPCEDCISREKVFDMIDTCNSDGLKGIFCSYADGERFKGYIKELPSVQPKVVPIAEIRFDDDKLHEIVNEAVKNIEIKSEWIVVKWHNITEEEREREGYPEEWLTILDCQMPNDGEEVLVTVKGRNGNPYVETDTCYFDGSVYSSDSGYDWIDDVVAWMPLPEPYKAESEERHD